MTDVKKSMKGINNKAVRRRKLKKKSSNKSFSNFVDNVAPVGGLFVFVGLVLYRNYLLSVDSTDAIKLHNYRRLIPLNKEEHSEEKYSMQISDVPAKLRGVHEYKIRYEGHKELEEKKLALAEVYTPPNKNRELSSMRMKRRYGDRKKLLVEKCGGQLGKTWNDSMQLIAVPERNFAACVVQKAGSSIWHKLAYPDRSSDESATKVTHSYNWIAATEFDDTTKDMLMSSESVSRIITVRHPFSRLISVWNNKFHKNFPLREQFIQMIGTYAGLHEPDENHVVAFRDFAQFIADTGLDDVDVPFKSIEELCRPCHFPYDYIIRAETAAEDIWYVLDRMNATTVKLNKQIDQESDDEPKLSGINNLSKTWTSESEITQGLFRTLPKETIEKLVEHYSDDFEKFGYTFGIDSLLVGDIID